MFRTRQQEWKSLPYKVFRAKRDDNPHDAFAGPASAGDIVRGYRPVEDKDIGRRSSGPALLHQVMAECSVLVGSWRIPASKNSPADHCQPGKLVYQAIPEWEVWSPPFLRFLGGQAELVTTLPFTGLLMSGDNGLCLMQRGHHRVEVKRSRLLPRRILHVVFYL
jgi:hypothetical protein